ncbi:hypothetical protein FN976_26720 [Caenimonas sedimenti]|uniref:Uncharacterized protein n=2 Tax=Caenimonas sedimenti TaxID=2596921 RepID=A0A562ZFX5_9BURK|nr:hypothetical protein FN976_26720 [Caenimonas sedimenti]
MAESRYGYASSGTGTVTATARVSVSVTVPKLILLRVGGSGAFAAGTDTVDWSLAAATPAGIVNGNNTVIAWDGTTAPTFTATAGTVALPASAWTNANAGTISCQVTTAFAAGGPAATDLTVAIGGGTLAHPAGANVGAACTGATTAFTSNSVRTSTWTYSLDSSNAANWRAGAYSAQITYTASGT